MQEPNLNTKRCLKGRKKRNRGRNWEEIWRKNGRSRCWSAKSLTGQSGINGTGSSAGKTEEEIWTGWDRRGWYLLWGELF